MKIASFFSGAGGLDLGFHRCGFEVVWANECDSKVWETYEKNFKSVHLNKKRIEEIDPDEIPPVDGFIGGPPCQSWSEAGTQAGINDPRGRLIYSYKEIIKEKKPKFFLMENVSGILSILNKSTFYEFIEEINKIGYHTMLTQVNAVNYSVPQDRYRVFLVGYRTDLGVRFSRPEPKDHKRKTLLDAIGNILESPTEYSPQSGGKQKKNKIRNHHYLSESFSYIYMSRNRVRSWEEQSFTIQASARHIPIHPDAPPMEKIDTDIYQFKKGCEKKYRRLSVRECARIQTFPDKFVFHYSNIKNGYKMVGNAVPVKLAKAFAEQIKSDLSQVKNIPVKPSVTLSPGQSGESLEKKRRR